MGKKIMWIGIAAAFVFATAYAAVGGAGHAFACGKSVKSAAASGCPYAATMAAQTAGCCAHGAKATTASASGCPYASAMAASASGCTKSAAAKAGAGCATSAKTASACCSGAKSAEARAAALQGIVSKLPYAERERVVVTGALQCAKCTYHATTTCQPLLKTADGKVYPLVDDNLVKKMQRSKGASFEVTSQVRNLDGVKYLDVKSYKVM